MALDTDRDIAAAIDFGLDTPFWKEWLLPEIQSRCKSTLRSLATSGSDNDDILRGWFQALEWVMNLPLQKTQEYRKIEEEQAREAQIEDLDEHRARYGFRSPYPSQPVPGELTEEVK